MPVVQVKLPDIGEGIAEGEIQKWLVKEGDVVKRFQPLVEVMTAKATVEIPSPYSGRVVRLLAGEGDTVKVGQPIAEIETSDSKAVEETRVGEVKVGEPKARETSVLKSTGGRIKAPPSVRIMARRMGIDLSMVKGTGPRGVITKDDLLNYASTIQAGGEARETVETVTAARVVREERIPLRGVKKIMAERMTLAKTTIPHAYVVEEADVTELLRVRERLKRIAEGKGVKLTLLPFIAKAVIKALREYPLMNSSLDTDSGEIIVKKYINLGIAVDTPNGLVVPVIKDAGSKGLFQLAREIRELAGKAREGKLTLDEVTGGTFSISNYGSIGGILGIPVVNPPEAAILGVARVRREPRIVDGRVEERSLLYITLSFDHRIIEGGYATRFLVRVKELLEDPILLLAGDGELD